MLKDIKVFPIPMLKFYDINSIAGGTSFTELNFIEASWWQIFYTKVAQIFGKDCAF